MDYFNDPLIIVALLAAFALAGAMAGTLAGLFGIGGGMITVPLMTSVFKLADVPDGTAVHLAVATSLATIIPTSIASMRSHAKHGAIDKNILKLWGPMIVVGAIAGSIVASMIHGDSLAMIFGVFSSLVAINFWRGAKREARDTALGHSRMGQRFVAFLIGKISAMLGIGGGVIGVMAMSYCAIPIHRAVATASTFGFMISVPGTIGYMLVQGPDTPIPFGTIGLVHPLALALLTPTAMLAAPFGARLAHRLNAARLRRYFALLLLFMAAKMIYGALT